MGEEKKDGCKLFFFLEMWAAKIDSTRLFALTLKSVFSQQEKIVFKVSSNFGLKLEVEEIRSVVHLNLFFGKASQCAT